MNPYLRTFDATGIPVILAPSTLTSIQPTTQPIETFVPVYLPSSPLVQQVQNKGEVTTLQQQSDEQKKKVYMYVGFGVGALALIFVLYKIFKK